MMPMTPSRPLPICASVLIGFGVLSGCGDGNKATGDFDAVRPLGPGSKCDRTWRGPDTDEAGAAGLFLDRRAVKSGGTLWAAIENLGTEELLYGFEPIAQKRVGDEWVRQEFTSDGEPMESLLAAVTLDPGAVSVCIDVPISDDWAPGEYRVSFEVTARESNDQVGGPGFPSRFRVLDRGGD